MTITNLLLNSAEVPDPGPALLLILTRSVLTPAKGKRLDLLKGLRFQRKTKHEPCRRQSNSIILLINMPHMIKKFEDLNQRKP